MTLRAEPTHPNRRAYVVKFHTDAKPGELCGRVENLVTCKHTEFGAADELIDWITRDIAACSAAESANETSATEPGERP